MMKTHRNQFQVLFTFATVCLLIGVNSALCDDYITYNLLPGSTFTPLDGTQITGPTENLTGSFQLHYEYHFQGETFKVTSLHFESDSYMLDMSANNNALFTVSSSRNYATFAVYADITNRPVVNAWLVGDGTYSGSAASPTSLNYTDIILCPADGGRYYGSLNLNAEQVPEPSSILFLAIGGLAFLRKR